MFSSYRARGIIAVSVLGLFLAGTLPGCCRPAVQPHVQRTAYAIFNPPGTQMASVDNARTDWPAAFAGDEFSEEIAYHEQFLDIQGRGYHSDDGYLYRRFQSDRIGRGRR